MIGRRKHAYTLLEVLLAISLVVGLVGSAFGFYNHTAKVRQRVSERVALARTMRAVMDRMTAELRTAIVAYPDLQMTLDMSNDVMEFTPVTIPSVMAWVVPKATDDPIPPESDVRLVNYSLGKSIDPDTGEEIITGLIRSCEKLPTIKFDPDKQQDLSVDTLAESIMFLRFRYWAAAPAAGATAAGGQIVNAGWVNSWVGPQLPKAVEITLGTEPLPDDMDVEEYLETYETFRRVVYLPCATP